MTDIASSSTTLEEARPECPYLYQYDSLEDKPSRTIRLLTVGYDGDNEAQEPSKPCDKYRDSDTCKHACGDTLNPKKLKVSLHEACLDDNPEYEAVSYAWGSAELVRKVACDSKWLWVTQSCYDLLVRLKRYSRGTRAARCYWIDAICINQGFQEQDTPEQRSRRERSHQVAMMATIYEKAVQVTVWPGHVEDGVRLGILLDSGLRIDVEECIPFLRPLIQQPYFTRIWPLQEIALAQRCIILIGQHTIVDIRSVFLMPHSHWWVRHNHPDNVELTSIRLEYRRVTTLHRRLLELFQSSLNNSNAGPGPSIPPSISEVLLHARSHQASEPRDKVFALYGILQRLEVYLEPPNYLRSVEDIYLEVSTAAICMDRSFRVFEGLTGCFTYDLPSWSPDWSDHDHITKVAEWNDYKASGSSEAQFSVHGRQLLAHGLRIDVVCQEHVTLATTSFLIEADTLAKSLAEPLRNLSNVMKGQYLDLLGKLFLDIWGDLQTRYTRDYAHRTWVQNDAEKTTDKNAVCRLIGYRSQTDTAKGVIKHCTILHAGACRKLDRKKLFQTRDGRLGIASEAVKSGDSIVLLQGCNLPMVVRPEGTKWKLIAPAYLPADGIMDGKLWRSDGPLGCFSFV
ncbi:hypothetical protein GT037_001395 [Alternaria burnsii]|uniref:Heterokaryon incompatibility domain-containing protein n=1 Tax=Alternaria burnsii TaxID=1187904 RepID=A0A8H7EJ05_9PLEO|nr:uncharacterized protein GT037_001395 [Alternaria burnsii]KAF7679744.1 hypothetical protein GT037_001395 [Alternaria burnsii]